MILTFMILTLCYDIDIFKLTAGGQLIYGEVYDIIYIKNQETVYLTMQKMDCKIYRHRFFRSTKLCCRLLL